MNTSSLNIKTKIALHSLGITFVLSAFLLISITLNEIPVARYLVMGLLTGEIFRIIFSRRRYLTTIQQDDLKITINYFNRMLIGKSISIEKHGLNILDIKEVNWWYGKLDLITFSNGTQNLTFDCIDKKLKKTALATLGDA